MTTLVVCGRECVFRKDGGECSQGAIELNRRGRCKTYIYDYSEGAKKKVRGGYVRLVG